MCGKQFPKDNETIFICITANNFNANIRRYLRSSFKASPASKEGDYYLAVLEVRVKSFSLNHVLLMKIQKVFLLFCCYLAFLNSTKYLPFSSKVEEK